MRCIGLLDRLVFFTLGDGIWLISADNQVNTIPKVNVKANNYHSSGVLEMNWLTGRIGSIERVGVLIMKQVERSSMKAWLIFNSLPRCWVVIIFNCVFQLPRGSVLIYTLRRIIQSSPLGNVNLTTSRYGMAPLASPECSADTAVSTARLTSGAPADIFG